MEKKKYKYILDIQNIEKSYYTVISDGEKMECPVLKGISFRVVPHDFIGIMGSSGCGKTTLLNILGMLGRPDKGKVLYKGISTNEIYGERLAMIRRKEIAFIFQDYYLMDSLSVKENIMLPLILNEEDPHESARTAEKIADKFKIAKLLNKKPYELSGGEKQRTAICRAIAEKPELILADEPTGNLDSRSAKIVMNSLSYINKKLGKTILMVTHDPQIASYCRKVLFLKEGKVLDILKCESDQEEFRRNILNQMQRMW